MPNLSKIRPHRLPLGNRISRLSSETVSVTDRVPGFPFRFRLGQEKFWGLELIARCVNTDLKVEPTAFFITEPDEVYVAVGVIAPKWLDSALSGASLVRCLDRELYLSRVSEPAEHRVEVTSQTEPEGPHVVVLLRWEIPDPEHNDGVYRAAVDRARCYLTTFGLALDERIPYPIAVRLIRMTRDGGHEVAFSPVVYLEGNERPSTLSTAEMDALRVSLRSLAKHARRDSILLAIDWHGRAALIGTPPDAFLAEFLALQSLLVAFRGDRDDIADSERAIFRSYSHEVLHAKGDFLFNRFSRLWTQRHRLFKAGLREPIKWIDYLVLRAIVRRSLRAELR